MLPDVLARILVAGQPFPCLLEWAKALDHLTPWKENGFLVCVPYPVLCSEVRSAVSFYIGSGISKADKVFAATELGVIARNPNVDGVTKDMVAYFKRCLETKSVDINSGFISR